jgi:hypothetical protein
MVLIAAAIIGLAGIQAAEPPAPPSAQPVMARRGPPPPDSVSGDKAVLPMTFTSGLPTISVTINGKGPFKIGFDTGAPGGPHLTDRLTDALGLSPFGEARASDPSGKNPIAVKLYRLDSAAFGPVNVKGWVATAQPVRKGRLESLDGLVGLDAFAGYVVTLDFAKGSLSIEKGALPDADGQRVFQYGGPIPSVPVVIEGQTVQAHLDTGNVRHPLIVPEAFALKLAQKDKSRPIGQAHTVSNTIEMHAVPLTGEAKVGPVSLVVREAGYPSIIDKANIGSLALEGKVLKVDPANKRIMIEDGEPVLRPSSQPTT